MRYWGCHRCSWAEEVAVWFCSEFVREGLLHKTAVLVKIFWFTNSKKSVLGKCHPLFMLGRWGYLPLAAVGDMGLVQPGCSSAWIEAAGRPKGPQHLLHFHQQQSSELDLVLQQPKARLLPTIVMAIMGTDIDSVLPLSPQILAAYVIPEQRFFFPTRSWISPWQPHTLSHIQDPSWAAVTYAHSPSRVTV